MLLSVKKGEGGWELQTLCILVRVSSFLVLQDYI